MAPTDFQTESDLQRNPLAAAEESVESEQRSAGTAFHAGALEFAAGPRLVLEGIVSTLLDVQAAVACQAAPAQVDELGHAIEVGAIQEIRGHAPFSLGRSSRLDQNTASNGAVEGMNNKIKSISHRSFGFRTAENFIAAIYHCCARLPLPVER